MFIPGARETSARASATPSDPPGETPPAIPRPHAQSPPPVRCEKASRARRLRRVPAWRVWPGARHGRDPRLGGPHRHLGLLLVASVRVAGTDLVAFTERDGTFFLAAVPAGQRHLAIYYTGLDQHTQEFAVTAGGLPPRPSASDGLSTPMPSTPSASRRFGTPSWPAASKATAS